MKRLACLASAILLAAVPALSAQSARAEIGRDGIVFAAASLKGPLDRAVSRMVKAGVCVKRGGTIRVSYASSGILARQIQFGAPADLFISADPKWVAFLEKQKRIVVGPNDSRTLFLNRLVVIAPQRVATPGVLGTGSPVAARLGRKRLAIGDPNHVPAGRYAAAALRSLGLWDRAKTRLVLAANVRVALAYVARRETPLGIVYRTDAIAEPKVHIVETVPASAHPPIRYVGAVPAAGNATCGRRWLALLLRADYRRIFADAGYGIPAER